MGGPICKRPRNERGVFLYAHTQRRAIFRAPDGCVKREPTDSALDALRQALAMVGGDDFECREIQPRQTTRSNHEQRDDDEEPTLVLACGRPEYVQVVGAALGQGSLNVA